MEVQFHQIIQTAVLVSLGQHEDFFRQGGCMSRQKEKRSIVGTASSHYKPLLAYACIIATKQACPI